MAYQSHRGAPKGYLLSVEEIAALRNVASRQLGTPRSCWRLKKLGLVEQKLGAWFLTQQGHISLMFCDAH